MEVEFYNATQPIAELYDTVVFIQGNKVDDVAMKKDKMVLKYPIDKDDDVTAKITELENATAYHTRQEGDYPNIGRTIRYVISRYDGW